MALVNRKQMFYPNYRPIRVPQELEVSWFFTLSVVGTTPLIEFGNESIDLSVKTGPEPEPGAHHPSQNSPN